MTPRSIDSYASRSARKPHAAFRDWATRIRIGSPCAPATWPEWDACPGSRGVPARSPRCTPSWPKRHRRRPRVRFWPWSRPVWTKGRPAPRRGESIGPDWLPARRGAAWASICKPGRATPAAPPVFRGVVLSTDALGHDLATSPDLDALVAGRAQRGLLLTIHDDPPALSGPGGPAHLT